MQDLRSRRVLVTWATKLGGTEGIARILAEELERQGHRVDLAPARLATADGYDAVIIGGALYANRWPAEARRFVAWNVAALRRVPVWMFSSGPLDATAEQSEIPPVSQVGVLMERVGARGHATFGGRLVPDAKGFPARAMAKTLSGDWRNPGRIQAWAREVAHALPDAKPGAAIDPPARSLGRAIAHGVTGWAACAAVMGGLLQVASTGVAVAIHAVLAPLIFAAIATNYFRAHGARDPVPIAVTWVAIVAALDLIVVAGAMQRGFSMFASVTGTWLPLGLIFMTTWTVGSLLSTMPWPKQTPRSRGEQVPIAR